MASYRNKNGGVEASVCVNGIRRSKTFTNKTRAKSWALETEKMLHDLRDGISTRDTLYSLFTRYGDEVSVHKKGVRWELIRLKAFKRYDFARIKLIDLKTEHLQAFIDMRLKLQVGEAVYNEFTVMIILNLGERVVGMVVDGVSDVIALSDEEIRPAPEFGTAMDTEYIQGLASIEERMAIVVDIEKLMTSSEMGLMDSVAEAL